MIIPKWLLPLISVVAAVAIGVAAALIGFQFASKTTVTTAAPTETIPVLQPISVGAAPFVNADGSFAKSATSVVATVTRPGTVTPGGIDPALQAQIEALNAQLDPPQTQPSGGSGSPAPDPTPAPAPRSGDDPCSASPIPPNCPGGVPAVVIGDRTSLAPLTLDATAYPPTPVEAGPLRLHCDYQSYGDGDVPMTLATSAPARITLVYWPISNPQAVTQMGFTATDDQRQQYNDALAAYMGAPGTFTDYMNQCFVLHGLTPGESYGFHAIAHDDLGRDAVKDDTFQARALDSRPPTLVTPVGLHTVSVRAARTQTQTMSVTVFALPDASDATCLAAEHGGGVPQHELPGADTYHDPAWYMTQNHWRTDFNYFETHTFSVPSGSRVVVCVKWYEQGQQFSGGAPVYVAQEALITPAVVHPTLSVVSYSLTRSVDAGAVSLRLDFPNGMECGNATIPEVGHQIRGAGAHSDTTITKTVCRLTDSIASGQGTSFDAVLHIVARPGVHQSDGSVFDGGTATTSDLVIPYFTDIPCDIHCSTGGGMYFNTNLGSGNGIVGTVVLRMTWDAPSAQVAGATGSWNPAPMSEGDYVASTVDEIGVAQAEEITYSPSPSGGGERLTYHLITAQPVTWEASLVGNSCRTLPTAGGAAGTTPVTEAVVTLDNLCPGNTYSLRLTLHAPGLTTEWQHLLNGRFWPQGLVNVPYTAGHLIVTRELTPPGEFFNNQWRLTVGSLTELPIDSSNSGCHGYTLETTHDFGETGMSWDDPLAVTMLAENCQTGALMRLELSTPGPTTLPELERGVTLTVDPSTGWTGHFFVVFRPDPL